MFPKFLVYITPAFKAPVMGDTVGIS